MHPTRRTLLDTAIRLLDTTPLEMLTCDDVLEASGVSRGSLYHHFEDYPDLVEHALVARFAGHVDESVGSLTTAFETSTSRDEFRGWLASMTRITQSPERARRRLDRVVTFANTANSTRLHAMLATEQQRLTDAYVELVTRAQSRGWVSAEVDPRAVAVLIQAYTLGRVVDDIALERVDPQRWVDLITRILDSAILND